MKKDPPKSDPAAEKKGEGREGRRQHAQSHSPLARDPNRQTFALEKLQALVKMYPKTEAAKEAQLLIDKIK